MAKEIRKIQKKHQAKKVAKHLGCPDVHKFKIDEIHPADYSSRTISEDNLNGLAHCIDQYGCVELIIVNIRKNKNRIIGGHQRYKVLQAAGVKELRCVTVDLPEAEEKLLNISLNNPHLQGEFTAELDERIKELQAKMPDNLLLNLRINQLAEEIAQENEKIGLVPDDQIPEMPEKTITKPGDLWILGEHRLLCGDSTNEKDVEILMDGQKASLFATEPPYCVDYTGADRPGGGKDWSNKYHESDISDARKFIRDFYRVGLQYVKPKTALYLWHADKRTRQIQDVCNELGILIHQRIIWVKPCIVLGFSFYAWRHELCFLMWRKGQQPPYEPKHKSIGTVWPVSYIKSGDPDTPEYYTDIWELDWAGKGRKPANIEHPTVKPIEVFAIPIRVHTKPGNICYEPFSGSGSQIIAAEKLGRRCFAMELELIFCDVAVKRWEDWTGKKAKRIKSK